MYAVFRKIFLASMLALVTLTTGAWQSAGFAPAEGLQNDGPKTPLYPGLTWENLGSSSRIITLNMEGDTVSLSGTGHRASEQFDGRAPQDVRDYYSNTALAGAGWESFNAYETKDGVHYVFYNVSGYYLSVEYLDCPDAPSKICMTVWKSGHTDATGVVPSPVSGSAPPPATTTFSKVSPAKDSTGISPINTILKWNAYSTTPDKYSYCIKEGAVCELNDPEWTGTYLNTSVLLTNLDYNRTYYWQVKAITNASVIPKQYVLANGGVWWAFSTHPINSILIAGNAGVAGATLTYVDVVTRIVTADSLGQYAIVLPSGWTGTITPSKAGYTFSPTSVSFTNLTATQTIQNFTATPGVSTPYIISGNAGVAGAILSYTDGVPKTAVADSLGAYAFTVSPNWSGTVVPSKGSYYFTPASRTYNNIVSHQTSQNYTISIFIDVPSTYWAFNYIERLYTAGITGGCLLSPLSYCPGGTVTRAQMAIFLLRGIHGAGYVPPAVGASTGFNDVPTNYWAAAWIKQFAAEGVTSGCGSGNYCPEATTTQAQMAIFLLRSKHGSAYTPPAVGSSTGFNDVPTTHWAAAWIKQLAAEGISTGCGNSNFCPETNVTRAQMAMLVVRTFNLP
ncbi:MAG: S-layer homology domain-containing protein [Chloroflexi bacterium]|nr:S-layer homology domain-containing protein [Chloroflexota bacterium]